MNIIYSTKIGNSKALAEKLAEKLDTESVYHAVGALMRTSHPDWISLTCKRADNSEEELSAYDIEGKTIVVTPTYENLREQKFGEPLSYTEPHIIHFVHQLASLGKLAGVVVTGNRTFGDKFCAAKHDFHPSIPILAEVELRGNDDDLERIADAVRAA